MIDARDPAIELRRWQNELCDLDTSSKEQGELERIVKETQAILGLDGWDFRIGFAAGERLEQMEVEEQMAILQSDNPDEKKSATIYLNKGRLGEMAERVIRHELSHVFLNPGLYPGGRFRTGMLADEIQAAHLEMAWERLSMDRDLHINDPESLLEAIDKSWWACHLDENDWEIHIEKKSGIYDGDERLPAFAHSLWNPQKSANGWGWGLFGARQIMLQVDERYIDEDGFYLPDVILKEMWRIVANPYGRGRTNIEEQKLGKIMNVMKKLGWGELAMGLAAKRGYHFRRLRKKAGEID